MLSWAAADEQGEVETSHDVDSNLLGAAGSPDPIGHRGAEPQREKPVGCFSPCLCVSVAARFGSRKGSATGRVDVWTIDSLTAAATRSVRSRTSQPLRTLSHERHPSSHRVLRWTPARAEIRRGKAGVADRGRDGRGTIGGTYDWRRCSQSRNSDGRPSLRCCPIHSSFAAEIHRRSASCRSP